MKVNKKNRSISSSCPHQKKPLCMKIKDKIKKYSLIKIIFKFKMICK